MRIFTLDDERILLDYSEKVLREAEPEAEVYAFLRAEEALRAVTEDRLCPDVVFSDIEMPGMSGLEFAEKLKELCPEAAVVFVTSYSEYATEAYRMHAHGYVIKPLEKERVQDEIRHAFSKREGIPGKLEIHCFGSFEVLWKGEPLLFQRRQTRELVAFLIDRQCRSCSAEEIVAALWEGERDLKAAKTRLRNLILDLKKTLTGIGMEHALVRRSGFVSLRKTAVDCDYYRLLEGEEEALKAYRGDYMIQYSWAEPTAGELYFRKK